MKYIIYVLLTILIVTIIVAGYYKNKSEENYLKYLNTIAISDSLVKVRTSNIYTKLISVDNLNRTLITLNSDKDKELKRLKSIIKEKNENIRLLVHFTTNDSKKKYEKVKTDTVYVEDEKILKILFNKVESGVTVDGYFQLPEQDLFMKIIRNPISFNVVITEQKNKAFRTYITSNDSTLIIQNVEGTIIPFGKNSFIKRLNFKPVTNIGWVKNEGIFIEGGVNIWKIQPLLKLDEKKVSYGIRFCLF
jgi:hypothetical protein